jgi:hypothetical protein
MDPETSRLVDARMRLLTLLCAALAFSLVVYVVVAVIVVGAAAGPVAEGIPPSTAWILAAVAVASLAAAETVSRAILGRASTSATTATARLDAYQQATIVGFAVRESAAVMGLVATFLTGEIAWCLALTAASGLAMAVAWPRHERVAAIAEGGPPPVV